MSIIVVIGLVLSCVIGIWKFVGRIKSEKRRLADEAGKLLEDGQKNQSKSDRLDAWHRAKWMR